MSVGARRAAEQHLKQVLRAASSWLQGGSKGSSWSSARQVCPVFTVNELPTDPFRGSCVLPSGGLRLNSRSPETLATRMTMQQLRGAKISGSEVCISTHFRCLLQPCFYLHTQTAPISFSQFTEGEMHYVEYGLPVITEGIKTQLVEIIVLNQSTHGTSFPLFCYPRIA